MRPWPRRARGARPDVAPGAPPLRRRDLARVRRQRGRDDRRARRGIGRLAAARARIRGGYAAARSQHVAVRGGTVHVAGDRRRRVDPHGEEREPREELDPGQLLHRVRHVLEIIQDGHEAVVVAAAPLQHAARDQEQAGHAHTGRQDQDLIDRGMGATRWPVAPTPSTIEPMRTCRAPFSANSSAVRRSGTEPSLAWFSANDASSSGAYSLDRNTVHTTASRKDHPAEVEGQPHRVRDLVRRGFIAHPEPRGQQPGEHRGEDRARADEEALHREAGRALLRREVVADEGAERLHARC